MNTAEVTMNTDSGNILPMKCQHTGCLIRESHNPVRGRSGHLALEILVVDIVGSSNFCK